jgi:hypothetical protein
MAETENKAPTQADIDAAEALGAAVAEAATDEAANGASPNKPKKAKKAKPKKAKKKPAGAKRKVGDWSGVDQILAFVLLANLCLMGILVLMGEDPKPAPEPGPGVEAGEEFPGLEDLGLDEESPGVRRSSAVEPRSALWNEAILLATRGDIPGAIKLLEELLRNDAELGASMGDVVRRTVYQQLAYYYGLDGQIEQAERYQALAARGQLLGMGPARLWELAAESTLLHDERNARAFFARFLLQQARMPDRIKEKVPWAYLALAQSYRREAALKTPGEKARAQLEQRRMDDRAQQSEPLNPKQDGAASLPNTEGGEEQK